MSTKIYARVESGAVVEPPQRLPAAWQHISNPAALPDKDLAELGWLPVVDEYEALLPGQEHGDPTLTVEPLRVVRTYPAVAAAVPQSITMRQCRLQLLAVGKLATVDSLINALPEPQRSAARIEWEYGTTVEINSPLFAQLGPALWADDAERDDWLRQAAAL